MLLRWGYGVGMEGWKMQTTERKREQSSEAQRILMAILEEEREQTKLLKGIRSNTTIIGLLIFVPAVIGTLFVLMGFLGMMAMGG
jgi:hypothetical protein